MSPLRLGVLISGSGSNMQAIIDRIEAGRLPAEIAIVIANEPDAGGLARARKHGLSHSVVNHRDFLGREAFERRLVEVLEAHQVQLVVLAGFMRVLTGTFLSAFPGRVMNIHPALLPAFPGAHVWPKELEYGIKIAGCTVHFVDEGVDSGPIIIQAAVPVMDDDDPQTLAARILKQEHRIYSRAIELYAQGRIKTEGRRVRILPSSGGIGPELETAVLINPNLVD